MDELVSWESRYLASASFGIPIELKLELGKEQTFFYLLKLKVRD